MIQDAQSVTQEQIAAAIKATEYKYFGDYEMSDAQRDAVDVLVRVAQARLASQPTSAEDAAAYQRGVYDAKCWLRDQQHKNPPDSLWHAAAILADRMDAALLASRPTPDTQTAATPREGEGE